jgi:BirA family biotin operon repressor/biotin-[acetyl-CoA-carboxylase] ligase
LFSLVIHTLAPVKTNLATPIAIAQAINRRGIRAHIKWPNDVWVQGKKVAGVLVDAQADKLIVGVGINAGAAPDNLEQIAAGLNIENPVELLADVINRLEYLLEDVDFSEIIQMYRSLDLLVDKEVVVMPKRLEDKSSHWNGICKGVDSLGFLVVVDEKGKEHTLSGEEVSIRPFLDQIELYSANEKQ